MKAVAEGRVEDLRTLLESGADPNVAADGGLTPLMLTWRVPGTTAVNLLVQAKANLDLVDSQGMTALMIAISYGRADIARVLLNAGADVGIKDRSGRSALSLAAQFQSDASLVKLLVEKGSGVEERSGNLRATPLMLAASSGNIDVMEALLAAGAKVESRDLADETPVFYAVALNRSAALRALLRHGASADATGKNGSLVHLAMSPGREECLGVLRDAGVEVPVRNPAVQFGKPNPTTSIGK